MMTKHDSLNKCALCGIMFKEETLFKVHIEKDHNNSDTIISGKDMVTWMEQLQREVNAEYGDDMSDVSLDKERHEALDREMNPADYV